MVNVDASTPVVVLHCGLGALSIMRTLGSLGVDVYGISDTPAAVALRSRYCRKSVVLNETQRSSNGLARFLLDFAGQFSEKPVMIATSDETAIAVARHHEELSDAYLIGQNPGTLVERLADKIQMFELANEYGLPSPMTVLPKSIEEVRERSKSVIFPVMLKGAMGNRLYERTGKKMVVVNDTNELLEQYEALEDPDDPNLMIQELIPGDDDQVYIFNGYFDAESKCRAAYTGRKIRQYPIHVGCASLGECCWVPEVAETTIAFMQRIGYRGVLDIGYRKDPRDSLYKVLDINPRVGQAFRLFVSDNGLDSVRAMYLDLTGQRIPSDVPRRENRRWMIEDYDLVSSFHYASEGSLTFLDWLKSLRRLEEGAWFSVRDPLPFLDMLSRLTLHALRWLRKRVFGPATDNSRVPAKQ